MNTLAVKVPVIESEAGWGRKIDDWMICLDREDSINFINEFNSKNDKNTTPKWYMSAEQNLELIELSEKQYEYLLEEKRAWLTILKNI